MGPGRSAEKMGRHDWLIAAVAAAPLVAVALVAVFSIGHGYHGVDDNAMNELRISDIGAHWPAIGPFSRDGWSHPGPMLFYVLAVPYWLTGNHSNGLLVGAALVNVGAVVGMIVLARRRGGSVFAWLVAVGCLVLFTSFGLGFFWDPWNPFIPVLPFGCVVLATWCVTCGDVWCMPIVAGVGTFCVQTHVGYAPLVGVLALVAAVGIVATRRQRREAESVPRVRAPLLVTLLVLVVLWLAPVVQQITTSPGNLKAIVDYFRSPNATHTMREGYNIVTAQFAWDPQWLVGGTTADPFTGQPIAIAGAAWPVWWAALAAGLGWAFLRRLAAARRLGLVIVAGIAASLVAIAATLGPIADYRLRFVGLLGMLAATFAVWMAWDAIAERSAPAARAIGIAALAGIAGLSLSNIVLAPGTDPPNVERGRIESRLAGQLLRRLPDRPGAVVLSVRSFRAGPLLTGLAVDLERAGLRVVLRDNLDDRLRFGAHRMLAAERVRAELRVATDDEIDRLSSSGCAHELAYWGRASRTERARARREVHRIEQALADGDLKAPDAISGIRRWSADLPAAAVYAIDAADQPDATARTCP